jgi:hypothetical protein
MVDVYAEFPPAWDGPNRFGINKCDYEQLTLPSILNNEKAALFCKKHGLNKKFEVKKYTHISYVKLKKKN